MTPLTPLTELANKFIDFKDRKIEIKRAEPRHMQQKSSNNGGNNGGNNINRRGGNFGNQGDFNQCIKTHDGRLQPNDESASNDRLLSKDARILPTDAKANWYGLYSNVPTTNAANGNDDARVCHDHLMQWALNQPQQDSNATKVPQHLLIPIIINPMTSKLLVIYQTLTQVPRH